MHQEILERAWLAYIEQDFFIQIESLAANFRLAQIYASFLKEELLLVNDTHWRTAAKPEERALNAIEKNLPVWLSDENKYKQSIPKIIKSFSEKISNTEMQEYLDAFLLFQEYLKKFLRDRVTQITEKLRSWDKEIFDKNIKIYRDHVESFFKQKKKIYNYLSPVAAPHYIEHNYLKSLLNILYGGNEANGIDKKIIRINLPYIMDALRRESLRVQSIQHINFLSEQGLEILLKQSLSVAKQRALSDYYQNPGKNKVVEDDVEDTSSYLITEINTALAFLKANGLSENELLTLEKRIAQERLQFQTVRASLILQESIQQALIKKRLSYEDIVNIKNPAMIISFIKEQNHEEMVTYFLMDDFSIPWLCFFKETNNINNSDFAEILTPLYQKLLEQRKYAEIIALLRNKILLVNDKDKNLLEKHAKKIDFNDAYDPNYLSLKSYFQGKDFAITNEKEKEETVFTKEESEENISYHSNDNLGALAALFNLPAAAIPQYRPNLNLTYSRLYQSSDMALILEAIEESLGLYETIELIGVENQIKFTRFYNVSVGKITRGTNNPSAFLEYERIKNIANRLKEQGVRYKIEENYKDLDKAVTTIEQKMADSKSGSKKQKYW